jgi:hypothetical protein
MLKWAMRIVAVSGALLAAAVATAAWMHRTEGREWRVATPTICSKFVISPRSVIIGGWAEPPWKHEARRFEVFTRDWPNLFTEFKFWEDTEDGRFGSTTRYGFGFVRGSLYWDGFTEVLLPTWALIAALLLPSGLWAWIGWRQRRRVKAGCCVSCGYDLRASLERCPECGREVKTSAER